MPGIGYGLATGAAQSYRNTLSPEAKTRRAALKVQKETAEQELNFQQENKETLAQAKKDDLTILMQEQQRTLSDLTKQRTYSAFDRYAGDNDTRHFNIMLQDFKSNPQAKKLFGNITRMDNIVEGDAQIVSRDLSPGEAQAMENSEDLRNDLVKLTMADGSTKAARLSELAAMTGYTRYADKRTLDRMKELSIIRRYAQGGKTTAKERRAARIAENESLEEGTPAYETRYLEVLQELNEKRPPRGTKQEREVQRILNEKGIEEGDEGYIEAYNDEYANVIDRDRETTSEKELSRADEILEGINETFGGEDQFFETDFSISRNRRKVERQMENFERLADVELSTQDKKDLGYIKELVALGEPGSELGNTETGALDRIFIDTKKYVANSVEGIAASSAYAAFRNTIRHALFGSVLTEGEMQSFNEQFGNLKQQTGPVLTQFRTAVEQVRTKLETLRNTNNSHVMYFRTGADEQRLDRIIDALDERIEAFSGFISKRAPEVNLTPEDTTKLDAIFGAET